MSIYRKAFVRFAVLLAVGASPSVSAMETEITLNQNKAIAGGVTPGDTPGFPITITRSGRYVLTSNLYPGADRLGIHIQAYDVTIDFNGFRLVGAFQGKHAEGINGSGVNTVTIMNGLIAGFTGNAISGNSSWVVENMRVSANRAGIHLENFARVQRNTITINGYGITCRDGCLVEGNVINENDSDGVSLNSGTVLGNTISFNKNFGIKSWGNTGEGLSPRSIVGFGNNTLNANNRANLGGSNAQIGGLGLMQLQPNACSPVC